MASGTAWPSAVGTSLNIQRKTWSRKHADDVWCWCEPGTLALRICCLYKWFLAGACSAPGLPSLPVAQHKGPSSPSVGSKQPAPFTSVPLRMRTDGRQDHRAGSLEALAGRELAESASVRGPGSTCLGLPVEVDGTGWFLGMTH